MIVNYLHVIRSIVRPPEANSPLMVDPNAVLTVAVACEQFKPVSAYPSEDLQGLSAIEVVQTAHRLTGEGLEGRNPLAVKQTLGISISERLDHCKVPFRF